MDKQLIQTATSHISPAPVKPGLPPSESGALQELSQALKSVKVLNACREDLEAVLRRIMLLVGIRAVNLPNADESQILILFIQKRFGSQTLEEIQLAFEKAVAGELDCDAATYENFSCEYFGRIMAAYKKWAIFNLKENKMLLDKPAQTTNLIEMKTDWKGLCEVYYQEYLSGKMNIRIMPHYLFDEFVRCDMMAKDAYEDWTGTAKERLLTNLWASLSECGSDSELHEQKQRIRKIENGEDEFKIVELAKKLAVEFLYKKAKQQKRKNLFVKA